MEQNLLDKNGIPWSKRFKREEHSIYIKFLQRIKNWEITPEQAWETIHMNFKEAKRSLGIYREPLYKIEAPNGLAPSSIWGRINLRGMTLQEAVTLPRLPKRPPIKYEINESSVRKLLDKNRYAKFLYYMKKGLSVEESFEKASNTEVSHKVPEEIRKLPDKTERQRAYRRWKRLGWTVGDAISINPLSNKERLKRARAKSWMCKQRRIEYRKNVEEKKLKVEG